MLEIIATVVIALLIGELAIRTRFHADKARAEYQENRLAYRSTRNAQNDFQQQQHQQVVQQFVDDSVDSSNTMWFE